ncbi:MAG: hypothetical protein ACOX81_01130 [Candidatus Heteroscillospira sp.]|jgi:hypothetical protein
MKKYKLYSNLLWLCAAVLSCAMSASVAYNWAYMELTPGISAPAHVSLLNAVPYLPLIILCAVLAYRVGRKAEK